MEVMKKKMKIFLKKKIDLEVPQKIRKLYRVQLAKNLVSLLVPVSRKRVQDKNYRRLK